MSSYLRLSCVLVQQYVWISLVGSYIRMVLILERKSSYETAGYVRMVTPLPCSAVCWISLVGSHNYVHLDFLEVSVLNNGKLNFEYCLTQSIYHS